MKNLLKGLTIVTLIAGTLAVGTKEIKEYKEVKEIKSNIENMISNNGSMETVKEGRRNVAVIEGEKVVITQDIENNNYSFTLSKDHENVINSVLMYMTGYNAFNTNIKNVETSFNTIECFQVAADGEIQVTFKEDLNNMYLEGQDVYTEKDNKGYLFTNDSLIVYQDENDLEGVEIAAKTTPNFKSKVYTIENIEVVINHDLGIYEMFTDPNNEESLVFNTVNDLIKEFTNII